MSTFNAKQGMVKQSWYIVDASNQVLGRLASKIAHYLRGKHKPEYTRHVDTGDYIVVINVDKIRVTGNKAEEKRYYRHSNHPGGLKSPTFNNVMAQNPALVLEAAVKGMLPHTSLARDMLSKLKVYVGAEHPHAAQQPEPLVLSQNKA